MKLYVIDIVSNYMQIAEIFSHLSNILPPQNKTFFFLNMVHFFFLRIKIKKIGLLVKHFVSTKSSLIWSKFQKGHPTAGKQFLSWSKPHLIQIFTFMCQCQYMGYKL